MSIIEPYWRPARERITVVRLALLAVAGSVLRARSERLGSALLGHLAVGAHGSVRSLFGLSGEWVPQTPLLH